MKKCFLIDPFHAEMYPMSYKLVHSVVSSNDSFYYMPSTFYIVKLPLALGNIFNWTESIMAQSHDGAKNPYWGLIMDFWHCLIVMTYRNCALFRLELG